MSHELAISKRAAAIKPSATLAVSGRAAELRALGNKVLNFSAGEPDFKPPTAVRKAVAEQAENEAVHYAPVPGTAKLRVDSPSLRGTVTEFVAAEKPARVHLETLDFFGNPAAVLVADGDRSNPMGVAIEAVNQGVLRAAICPRIAQPPNANFVVLTTAKQVLAAGAKGHRPHPVAGAVRARGGR